MITSATVTDLPEILNIYKHARTFMAQNGNNTQWADGYPHRELLLKDIQKRQLYLCCDAHAVYGVFAFIIGEDTTYAHIEDGSWLSDAPYGTIHRIASAGIVRGIADACLEFCLSAGVNIRIDTHADNHPMLSWIRKRGFEHCGIIRVEDGSPRIAFQLGAAPLS